MTKAKTENDAPDMFHDQMLGKLALNYKLISNEIYIEAINIQKKEIKAGLDSTIHEVLIKHEFLTKEEMELLHNAKNIITQQRKKKRFGVIAIKKGLLTESEIEEALKIQKNEKKEIGQILLDSGLISTVQCEEILHIQKSITVKLPSLHDIQTTHDNSKSAVSPLQNTFELNVSEDDLTAVLILPPFNDDINVDDIHKVLRDHDVCFGIINDTVIEDYLKYKHIGLNSFIVAKGENSIYGVSGEPTLHFTPRELKPGELDEDGKIDYKDRGDIPYVTEEDLLAERKIMQQSKPGTNVFGQIIEVDTLEDIVFISGSGTVYNEAGDKIIAECNGEPFINLDGSICVLNEYRVDDVNFETGNIKFDGNVIIDGKVNSDFIVEGINITAREVIGARIIAEGDVIVDQGIIGADITATGKVQATYMKDCKISCIGDVIVEKEILDCEIESSGICHSRGNILSSKIYAAMGVSSLNIGSNSTQPNHVEFGSAKKPTILMENEKDKNKIDIEFAAIQEQKDNIKSMIKILYNIIQEIELDLSKTKKEQSDLINTITRIEKKSKKIVTAGRQRIGEFETKIAAAEETLKALNDDKTSYNEKLAETEKRLQIRRGVLDTINRKLNKLTRLINENKSRPVIRVFDTIIEGTKITGANASLVLKNDFSNVSLNEIRNAVPENPNKFIHHIEITQAKG